MPTTPPDQSASSEPLWSQSPEWGDILLHTQRCDGSNATGQTTESASDTSTDAMENRSTPMEFLSVRGSQIVDAQGNGVRLRGTCIGGWMNLEDFINGFSGAEHPLRAEMREVLGARRSEFFFERFLEHFFNEEDIRYIKSLGMTAVRLPLNYRHFEDDDK